MSFSSFVNVSAAVLWVQSLVHLVVRVALTLLGSNVTGGYVPLMHGLAMIVGFVINVSMLGFTWHLVVGLFGALLLAAVISVVVMFATSLLTRMGVIQSPEFTKWLQGMSIGGLLVALVGSYVAYNWTKGRR